MLGLAIIGNHSSSFVISNSYPLDVQDGDHIDGCVLLDTAGWFGRALRRGVGKGHVPR